jgi:DNA-binding CsgD family transcriptional regulator
VARLAAEGRTAREIAEQLFVSERTVETHLTQVYAKLGVASKLDLVRQWPELAV